MTGSDVEGGLRLDGVLCRFDISGPREVGDGGGERTSRVA